LQHSTEPGFRNPENWTTKKSIKKWNPKIESKKTIQTMKTEIKDSINEKRTQKTIDPMKGPKIGQKQQNRFLYMRGGEFQKMGVSRTKESIQKRVKNVIKTTGKTIKTPKIGLKLQYIYIYAALLDFRGLFHHFQAGKWKIILGKRPPTTISSR
jgi:hypothetical protein